MVVSARIRGAGPREVVDMDTDDVDARPLAVFDVDDTVYTGFGGKIPLYLTAAHKLFEQSAEDLLGEDVQTDYRPEWFESEEWTQLRERVEETARAAYTGEHLDISDTPEDPTDTAPHYFVRQQADVLGLGADPDLREVGKNYVSPELLEDINQLYWLLEDGRVENPREAVLETAFNYFRMLHRNEEEWVEGVYADVVEEVTISDKAQRTIENFALHNDLRIVSNNHQLLLEKLADDLLAGRRNAVKVHGTEMKVDDDGRYVDEFTRNMFRQGGKDQVMAEIADSSNTGRKSVAFGDDLYEDLPLFARVENAVLIDPRDDIDETDVREEIEQWKRATTGPETNGEPENNGSSWKFWRSGGDDDSRVFTAQDMDAVWEDLQRGGEISRQIRGDAE